MFVFFIEGINEVFEEYRLFNDSIVVTEDNLPSYTRAVTRLNKLLPYEEELVNICVTYTCMSCLVYNTTRLCPLLI